MVISEHMPSSAITGSYGSFILSFLRYLHTVLHSGCISLHSHQQCKRVLFSPHTLSSIYCLYIFEDVHSDWCEVISHCNFDLHFSGNEYLFMCLLAICMSSLKKYLFRPSVHFLIRLFVFLVLSFMSCLYILEINHLWVVSFAIIFSHSEGCRITLFIVCWVKVCKFD